MNRFNKLFYSNSSHYQVFFFMQKNNTFHILQSFDKKHKIVILHLYHENADTYFASYCQYVGEEAKPYRHILREWYIYKLPGSIFSYNSIIYDFYSPKKIPVQVPFQIPN